MNHLKLDFRIMRPPPQLSTFRGPWTCRTSFLKFVFLNGSVVRYTNTFWNSEVKEAMRSFEADMRLKKKVKQNGGNNYLHNYADIMS